MFLNKKLSMTIAVGLLYISCSNDKIEELIEDEIINNDSTAVIIDTVDVDKDTIAVEIDTTLINTDTTEVEPDSVVQLVSISPTDDIDELPSSSTYSKESHLKGTTDAPYGFVIRKPSGFGTDDNKYPIIIYLHGSGSRGDNDVNPNDLNKADTRAAMASIKKGTWKPKVDMAVFAPQCPKGKNWVPQTVNTFINYVIDTYGDAINTNRIYLSGFSMGGYGSWNYLDTYGYEKSKIAAVVTMSGAGENSGKVDQLKMMPFWVFHGKKDKTVPSSRTSNLYDKFNTAFPNQNHQKSTIFTQDDDDLYNGFHNIDTDVYSRKLHTANYEGDLFDMDVTNWMLQYRRED